MGRVVEVILHASGLADKCIRGHTKLCGTFTDLTQRRAQVTYE